MILLANKTNVKAPDATDPYGMIKDDTGSNDGTPVDLEVYGDIHQFFAKMFAESGLTANNLPDNQTNGYQLWEALKETMGVRPWTSGGAITASPAGGTTISAISTLYNKYRLVGKTLDWQFAFSATIGGTSPSGFSVPIPASLVASNPGNVFYGRYSPTISVNKILHALVGAAVTLQLFDSSTGALGNYVSGTNQVFRVSMRFEVN